MQETRMLTRRGILMGSLGALVTALLGADRAAGGERRSASGAKIEPLSLPPEAWRKRLTPEQYAVLFKEGTERPFSSPLDREKREGTFVCAACHLPLFESSAKFDSGTGWPSFFQPIEGHVGTRRDFKLLLPRTEYHCARCGGHQGHVFEDGPPPTGQRWCNNGVALRFVPTGEPLPALVN
jgi:peptide-methionine (R)-S-oxide reductase